VQTSDSITLDMNDSDDIRLSKRQFWSTWVYPGF